MLVKMLVDTVRKYRGELQNLEAESVQILPDYQAQLLINNKAARRLTEDEERAHLAQLEAAAPARDPLPSVVEVAAVEPAEVAAPAKAKRRKA